LPLLASLLAVGLATSPLGRGLTAGERALLAPLFRDAVNYDAIRIVPARAFRFQGPRTLVTIGDVVYAPPEVYSQDFAQDGAHRQAVLVHEVTHVWQHENGISVIAGALRAFFATGGRYSRAYRYQLAPGRDLLEYGIEQQASIVEHYFLGGQPGLERALGRFLADPTYPRRWMPKPVRRRARTR
jgi:hypothetical protein